MLINNKKFGLFYKMEKNESDITQKEELSLSEKEEIQKKNDKLKSILQGAHDALKSINKKDINEIKSLMNPPVLIKLTMQCILILLGHKISHSSKVINKIFHFLIFFYLSRKQIGMKSGMSPKKC